jgi:predicted aldo/keto reductase-like oxidoreductase
MSPSDLNRRDVLKSMFGMTAALLAPEALLGQATRPAGSDPIARDRWGELLPQRKLGKKGPMVTMLGVGGAHIAAMDDANAQATIEAAIAGGIRFFEMGSGYSNGQGEIHYGNHLTPKYRDDIFLVTKFQGNSGAQARQTLDAALARMKTDHVDLWQIHSIHSADDVDLRVRNGVLDAFLEAKEKGKAKHIGFTGHVTPESHLHLLKIGIDKGDAFTTCQMPINVIESTYNSFIVNFVPKAVEAGLAVIAMKTLANGRFFGGTPAPTNGARGRNAPSASPTLIPDRLTITDALHFVWSLPVSVALTGVKDPKMLQEKIAIARAYSGMTDQRRQELIGKVVEFAGTSVESYKIPPVERGRGAGNAAVGT